VQAVQVETRLGEPGEEIGDDNGIPEIQVWPDRGDFVSNPNDATSTRCSRMSR